MNTTLLMLNLVLMTTATQQKTAFALPVLPYELSALEPQISEQTMRYHYGKHHKAYIDKLNELIRDTQFENYTLEDIILRSDGPIFNNASQAWNHTFYFMALSPNPKSVPTGQLGEAINRDFGSFDEMKARMEKAAGSLFGSGWVWLAADKRGRLSIVSENNAGNPMTHGLKPLLALDVWEHAYYIDYRNARVDSVKALWDRVDWRVVEERYR